MYVCHRMADKDKRESKVTSHLPMESSRVIAESVGVGGIPDEAATLLAEDATYRLKQMVQVGWFTSFSSSICSVRNYDLHIHLLPSALPN